MRQPHHVASSRRALRAASICALPRWLAQGGETGEVPRRSIALVTAGSMLSLVLAVLLDLGVTPLMLLATGCFTLVYVLGTASALRLLPRGTRGWWTALVAHVSVVVLLVVNGVHALWALGLVVLSLAYQSRSRRR